MNKDNQKDEVDNKDDDDGRGNDNGEEDDNDFGLWCDSEILKMVQAKAPEDLIDSATLFLFRQLVSVWW